MPPISLAEASARARLFQTAASELPLAWAQVEQLHRALGWPAVDPAAFGLSTLRPGVFGTAQWDVEPVLAPFRGGGIRRLDFLRNLSETPRATAIFLGASLPTVHRVPPVPALRQRIDPFFYIEALFALEHPAYLRERDRKDFVRVYVRALEASRKLWAAQLPVYAGASGEFSETPGALFERMLRDFARSLEERAREAFWAGEGPEPLPGVLPESPGPGLVCPLCGCSLAGHWGRGANANCFARAYALPEEAELEALAWGVTSIPAAAVISERPLILNRFTLIFSGLQPLFQGV